MWKFNDWKRFSKPGENKWCKTKVCHRRALWVWEGKVNGKATREYYCANHRRAMEQGGWRL